MPSFIVGCVVGYVLCAIGAMFMERDARKRYDRLYANFLNLVNEMSIRSGGRTIFKDKKPVPISQPNQSMPERGEFRIVTPSMAEVEAMDRDDNDHDSNIDEVDLEHLRRSGVLN